MNREENKKVWDALDNINRAKCALEAMETCGGDTKEAENMRQALHIIIAVIRDNLETLEEINMKQKGGNDMPTAEQTARNAGFAEGFESGINETFRAFLATRPDDADAVRDAAKELDALDNLQKIAESMGIDI